MRMTAKGAIGKGGDLLDERLLEFATPRQAEALRAVNAAGGHRRLAASALGIPTTTLKDRVRKLLLQAASRGYSPPHDWQHPVPEGHRVKGNSTRYNAVGEVDQQWVKSERDTVPKAHPAPPPDHIVTGTATYVDGQGAVRGQWVTTRRDHAAQWEAITAAVDAHVASYRGIADPIDAPAWTDDSTLSIYPVGDPHIGMLSWGQETGEDFDLSIAERDLKGALRMLVAQAPPSKRAIFASVGDTFHADDDKQVTPGHGHKLDVDTRAGKVFRLGCALMRSAIDLLLTKHAHVDAIIVPGNHDPLTSRFLCAWLEAVYEREPRVTIAPNLNPYAYVRFGSCLFGFTHGDGVKPRDLPEIMATDRPEDWGQTQHRHWLTGHVHHDGFIEYRGCTVEHFRTLAGRDYWHHWRGYRSGRSLSRITYHEQWGEISRGTVDLQLARAVMAGETTGT
jgi:hypothetical protein